MLGCINIDPAKFMFRLCTMFKTCLNINRISGSGLSKEKQTHCIALSCNSLWILRCMGLHIYQYSSTWLDNDIPDPSSGWKKLTSWLCWEDRKSLPWVGSQCVSSRVAAVFRERPLTHPGLYQLYLDAQSDNMSALLLWSPTVLFTLLQSCQNAGGRSLHGAHPLVCDNLKHQMCATGAQISTFHSRGSEWKPILRTSW